jgi:hypothetical protein
MICQRKLQPDDGSAARLGIYRAGAFKVTGPFLHPEQSHTLRSRGIEAAAIVLHRQLKLTAARLDEDSRILRSGMSASVP